MNFMILFVCFVVCNVLHNFFTVSVIFTFFNIVTNIDIYRGEMSFIPGKIAEN